MKFQEIKELIELINNTDTTYFEFNDESGSLKISKLNDTSFIKSGAAVTSDTREKPAHVDKNVLNEVKEDTAVEKKEIVGNEVKSPIVGTFYNSSAPDKEPFVKIGDKVKKGSTLCIIEAMKVMNEIVSEFDGEVLAINAENGQLLEYGQTIFVIG